MYRYLAVICCRKPSEKSSDLSRDLWCLRSGLVGLLFVSYVFPAVSGWLVRNADRRLPRCRTAWEIKDNLSCLGETFPYLLVALVIALVFWCFFRFICRKNYRFFLLLIISLILEQLFVWYRLQKHIEYPGSSIFCSRCGAFIVISAVKVFWRIGPCL